ncbi:MAG: hypothetical protein ABI193_27170, partial [Minicystis sp.]
QGIWFVYRSHYEGPLSKRVRRLAAPSVLAWFQAMIEETRVALAPKEVVSSALGGRVYGLATLFDKVKDLSLHTPKTTAALSKLLHEHLSVEGGPEAIKLDAHTLSVLTDDDEVHLAYYFFDDEAVRKDPALLAYLLHDEPELPEGNVDAPFTPLSPVRAIGPAGSGEGATYACLLTFYDGDSLPGKAVVLPGVRYPGLVDHLLSVQPEATPQTWSEEWFDTWPVELRLLRAMIEPGDRTLTPALTRAAAYPLGPLASKHNHSRLGLGPQAGARAEFTAAADPKEFTGDTTKSIVNEGEHTALLAAHASAHFGHQQWVIFDDRWAAAQPNLASSLLHYAQSADPFRLPKPEKVAKAKVEKAPKAPKAEKAPKAPKRPAKPAAETAAVKAERAWQAALGERATDNGRPYKPSDRFDEGALVLHAKFGLGLVTRSELNKCEMLFKDRARVMVQGAAP